MSVKISYQSACVINHIILSELWHNRSVCNKSPIYTAHSTEHSNKVSFLEWWFLHYFLFQIVLENSSFLFSYPVKANFDWSPDLHNKVQGIHYMYVAEKNQWSVSSSVLNSFKKKKWTTYILKTSSAFGNHLLCHSWDLGAMEDGSKLVLSLKKYFSFKKFPTQLPSVLSYMYITQQTEEGTFVFLSVHGPLPANNKLCCLNKNIFLIFMSLTEIIVWTYIHSIHYNIWVIFFSCYSLKQNYWNTNCFPFSSKYDTHHGLLSLQLCSHSLLLYRKSKFDPISTIW